MLLHRERQYTRMDDFNKWISSTALDLIGETQQCAYNDRLCVLHKRINPLKAYNSSPEQGHPPGVLALQRYIDS